MGKDCGVIWPGGCVLQNVLDMTATLGDKTTVGREAIQERLDQFVQHWEQLKELSKARWVEGRRPSSLLEFQVSGWCCSAFLPQLPISISLLSPCSGPCSSPPWSFPLYPGRNDTAFVLRIYRYSCTYLQLSFITVALHMLSFILDYSPHVSFALYISPVLALWAVLSNKRMKE